VPIAHRIARVVEISRPQFLATSRRRRVAWCLAIVAVVAIAYHNSLGVPFLLDDHINVVDNDSIRSFTTAWSPPNETYTAGRPILNLSFALSYALHGQSPAGYHAGNVLIHALAALTLFGVVRRLLRGPLLAAHFAATAEPLAAAAALVWAAHPINCESVTYISQRAESLMGLFYFVTVYAFIRATEQPGRVWRALTVIACVAGMLTKEVMATAPIMLVLLDRAVFAGSFREVWRRRGWLHAALAAMWVILAVFMMTTKLEARGVGFSFDLPWHRYARIEMYAVLHYLGLGLWPFPLVFDYGFEVPVPAPAIVFACGLVLAGIAGATVFAWRRSPALALPVIWFFLLLMPTSSVVPVAAQPIAENRVYVPLAGMAILGVIAAYRWLGRRALLLAGAAVAALTCATIARNADYATSLTIWTDTLAKRPGSSRAHVHYGTALAFEGRNDEALRILARGIEIRHYSEAHLNLGAVLAKLGRWPDATRHFSIALQLKPDADAHRNLGAALFQEGKKEEALHHFREARRLRPTYLGAQINEAIVLAHLGRPAEAIATIRDVLRQEPANAEARSELEKMLTAFPGHGTAP
jgi:protein O-mannosyl-transferase